jgi:hypothetical protein
VPANHSLGLCSGTSSLSPDSSPRSLTEFTAGTLGHERFKSIDRIENDGLDVIAHFTQTDGAISELTSDFSARLRARSSVWVSDRQSPDKFGLGRGLHAHDQDRFGRTASPCSLPSVGRWMGDRLRAATAGYNVVVWRCFEDGWMTEARTFRDGGVTTAVNMRRCPWR